jgi:hypothetical protein
MLQVGTMPEWAAVPILSAIIASLGYVAKLAADAWLDWRRSVRERQASLVALQSLLLASKRVFDLQAVQRNILYEDLKRMDPSLVGKPFDEVLVRAYINGNDSQKMMHGLIRQYTISAMLPLNRAMTEWLSRDTYYKLQIHSGDLNNLSMALRTLEAHLVLWKAKYDFWIPERPERALVYMNDEYRHGAGFPFGIEALVEKLAGGTKRSSEEHKLLGLAASSADERQN